MWNHNNRDRGATVEDEVMGALYCCYLSRLLWFRISPISIYARAQANGNDESGWR